MYNDTERNSSQLADESYSTGEGMIWKSVLKDKMEDDEFKIGLKILQREKNQGMGSAENIQEVQETVGNVSLEVQGNTPSAQRTHQRMLEVRQRKQRRQKSEFQAYLKSTTRVQSILPAYQPQNPMIAMWGGMNNDTQKLQGRQDQKYVTHIKQKMIEEYYQMLKLMRQTQDFRKIKQFYEKIYLGQFQELTVIGIITEIQNRLFQGFFCLMVVTGIMIEKVITEDSVYQPAQKENNFINRRILLPSATYFKLLSHFNHDMNNKKKRKPQNLLAFTSLRPILCQGNLYFALSKKSEFLMLQADFYQRVIKPMESLMDLQYAQLSLKRIFPTLTDCPLQLFNYNQIKDKLLQRKNRMSMQGLITSLDLKQPGQFNKRQKEVMLQVRQTMFPPEFRSIGCCKIALRYDNIDHHQLMAVLSVGHVYLFADAEMAITENIGIMFKVANWRRNVIKLSEKVVENSRETLQNEMRITSLQQLNEAIIFRNIMKFKVFLQYIKMFYAKVVCEKCGSRVQHKQCLRNNCEGIQGALLVWVIARVNDGYCGCDISLDNQLALEFFQIQHEYMNIKENVERADVENKGIVIYSQHDKFRNLDNISKWKPATSQWNYFEGLTAKITTNYVDKIVLGSCRCNKDENYRVLPDEDKMKLQLSFLQSKRFLKQNKLNLNGYTTMTEGVSTMASLIKVTRVIPV